MFAPIATVCTTHRTPTDAHHRIQRVTCPTRNATTYRIVGTVTQATAIVRQS